MRNLKVRQIEREILNPPQAVSALLRDVPYEPPQVIPYPVGGRREIIPAYMGNQ